jgi:hypothetical protein
LQAFRFPLKLINAREPSPQSPLNFSYLMENRTSSTSLLSRITLAGLFFLVAAAFSGCATKNPDQFERDDFFGGHGNAYRPNHHVPDSVERVHPWLPLF